MKKYEIDAFLTWVGNLQLNTDSFNLVRLRFHNEMMVLQKIVNDYFSHHKEA